jgi:hypothetical protein
MRINKISTIPFKGNDFEVTGVSKEMVKVPVSSKLSFYVNDWGGAQLTAKLYKKGSTVAVSSVSSGSSFLELVSPSLAGVYYVKIDNGGYFVETSENFLVLPDRKKFATIRTWCEEPKTDNNGLEASFRISGLNLYYFHYIFKPDFSIVAKENNVIYNDNDNHVINLFNGNYNEVKVKAWGVARHTAEFICNYRRNSFFQFEYYDNGGVIQYMQLFATSECEIEELTTSTVTLSFSGTYRLKKTANRLLLDTILPYIDPPLQETYEDGGGNTTFFDFAPSNLTFTIPNDWEALPTGFFNFDADIQTAKTVTITNAKRINEIPEKAFNKCSVSGLKIIKKVGKNSYLDGDFLITAPVIDSCQIKNISLSEEVIIRNSVLMENGRKDSVQKIKRIENCEIQGTSTIVAKEYVNCTLGFETVDNYTELIENCTFANSQLNLVDFYGKIRKSKAGGVSLTIIGDTTYDIDDESFCNEVPTTLTDGTIENIQLINKNLDTNVATNIINSFSVKWFGNNKIIRNDRLGITEIEEINATTSRFYFDFDGFMNGMSAGAGTINFSYFSPRYANAFNNILFSDTILGLNYSQFLHYLTAGNCFNRSRIKQINLNFSNFDMKNLYKYVRNVTSWNNIVISEGIRITAYDEDKPVIVSWLQEQLPNITIQ